MAFTIKVNGAQHSVEVDGGTPLLWVLRDTLGLAGTKYGCGIAQCGACTVFLNGKPLRSCALPVSALGNGEITTIEGVRGREAVAVQRAWIARDVPQCGYCLSGQVMSAIALLKEVRATHRSRHRPRHERQHLPMCHLRSHPRRHQGCGAYIGGVRPWLRTTSSSPAVRLSRALLGSSSASICPPQLQRPSRQVRRTRCRLRQTPSSALAPTTR
jgi:isoquinoline 1-oxidoreductase alpha subunit